MNVATFVLVAVGAVIALAGLYYTARSNTLTSREKAVAAAREPLLQQLADVRSDLSDVKAANVRLLTRCDQLEDELRRRR